MIFDHTAFVNGNTYSAIPYTITCTTLLGNAYGTIIYPDLLVTNLDPGQTITVVCAPNDQNITGTNHCDPKSVSEYFYAPDWTPEQTTEFGVY